VEVFVFGNSWVQISTPRPAVLTHLNIETVFQIRLRQPPSKSITNHTKVVQYLVLANYNVLKSQLSNT